MSMFSSLEQVFYGNFRQSSLVKFSNLDLGVTKNFDIANVTNCFICGSLFQNTLSNVTLSDNLIDWFTQYSSAQNVTYTTS